MVITPLPEENEKRGQIVSCLITLSFLPLKALEPDQAAGFMQA
jgi:hypothetical protein